MTLVFDLTQYLADLLGPFVLTFFDMNNIPHIEFRHEGTFTPIEGTPLKDLMSEEDWNILVNREEARRNRCLA